MKVGLRTLTTAKILMYGYHGNGCYGHQITFSQLKYTIYDHVIFHERSRVRVEKGLCGTHYHGNQYVAMTTVPQEGQLPVALTKEIEFHTYKWYLPIQLTIYPFLKLESTSSIHVLQRPFHKKCV